VRIRRAGVALLEAAPAFSRETEAVGTFLERTAGNMPAQRVDERTGWRREGRFLEYNAPL
jgi:hypothetical protein